MGEGFFFPEKYIFRLNFLSFKKNANFFYSFNFILSLFY